MCKLVYKIEKGRENAGIVSEHQQHGLAHLQRYCGILLELWCQLLFVEMVIEFVLGLGYTWTDEFGVVWDCGYGDCKSWVGAV